MNKKLLAVAVAGVFAAPAVALAQTTIYGTLKAEYGFVDQPKTAAGLDRASADGLNSGASNIGFRGEEKLGGGMSAWYQCESDLRFLSGSTRTSGSICDRNSAIGLKGGFGNFYIGTWDSPIKRASGVTRITEETGWTGSQHMTLSSDEGPSGFSERYTQSFNYDTPNMGGFTASAQVTTTNAAFNQLDSAAVKGRAMGLGAQFATGPLAIVAALDRRDENRSELGGPDGKDQAWLAGVRYRIGPVTLGFTYTDLSVEDGAGLEATRTAWNLAGEWQIGAGAIRVGYANADSIEVNGTELADTGATQMQIGYWHNLSKRTKVYAAYVKLDNDDNAAYNLTGLTTGDIATGGESASVLAFGIFHTF